MVVTEFVFVQLKQDASLRDQALPVLQDMVKEVEKSPANVRGTLGRVATEQSIDVSQEARPVLLAGMHSQNTSLTLYDIAIS